MSTMKSPGIVGNAYFEGEKPVVITEEKHPAIASTIRENRN